MALSADLIRVAEAARLIDRTPQRVRQLIREGRLKAEPTPYGHLVSRQSCMAYVAERDRQNGTKTPA